MNSRTGRRWAVAAGLIAGFWFSFAREPGTGAGDDAAVYAAVLRELTHAAPMPRPVRFVSRTAESPISPTFRPNPDGSPRQPPPFRDDMSRTEPGTRAAWMRVLDDTGSLAHALPHARVWPVTEAAYSIRKSRMRQVMLAPLHTFSRIGYNQGRTQAIVYAGYRCGGMCGDGQIVLLERRGGRWTIVQTERLWIS